MSQEKPKRGSQYAAALAATLGGFSLGTVIGWGSSAQPLLKKQYNIENDEDFGISFSISIMAIGAACAMIYMAFTLDTFGRKVSMLITAFPIIAGWLMIAFANNIGITIAGRFITGFFAACFCVAAPTYTGEIADKGIRGTLGVFFQFLMTIGILYSYCLAFTNSLMLISVACAVVPILFFIMILFLPESPVFLMKQAKPDKARKSMQFFRGKDYNIEPEMKEIEEYIKGGSETFWGTFKKSATIKAFVMLLVMNIVQQLSGINAVMFYAQKIFDMADTDMDPKVCAVIMGTVQVCVTCFSAFLVEKAGRKLLWVLSLSLMAICLIGLGGFFFVFNTDEATAKTLGWLPLTATCLYIAGLSLGTGPLPWVMLGELLPVRVKGPVGSFVTWLNWMLAFTVGQTFPLFTQKGWKQYSVFFFFAIICVLGIVFVLIFLIETKNKSLEQIQEELGGGGS